jgi:hypothetical protein
MNWKGCGRNQYYYHGIAWKDYRKPEILSSGRDLNPEPPKYETEVMHIYYMNTMFFGP